MRNLIIFLLFLGCAPGLKLSFDDDHIDNWYENRELLEEWKATLYVTRFDCLTVEQLCKLRELEIQGCEIGCHGFRHLNAVEYLKTHTIDEYILVEIIPAIQIMKLHGFEPESFAYPFGTRTPELDEMLKKYFKHIRPTDDVPIDFSTLEECLKSKKLHGHLINEKVKKILEEK